MLEASHYGILYHVSGRSSKQKGYRVEREIVLLHKDLRVECDRMPLSGALGGDLSGDLHIEKTFKAEVKARKDGGGFKTLESWLGDNDMLFLRKNNKKPMVAMTWDMYVELIQAWVNQSESYSE